MKLRWILRPKAKPGRSIEQLFAALAPHVRSHPEIELEVVTLPGSGNLLRDFRLQRKFLKSLQPVDLCHVLGDVHYLAPFINSPQVHTFHDLESLFHGPRWKQRIKKELWVNQALKRSVGVSAISQHTKSQLEKCGTQHRHKMTCIPNPLLLAPRTNPEFRSPQRQWECLSIGTKDNKNLTRAAAALAPFPNVKWHVVGALSDQQKQWFNSLGIVYQNHLDLSDQALSDLYSKCHFLLFPSLYEGFGLPILEALAHGCGVICSNLTAMPEAAGNAAIFVDPLDTSSIETGIQQMLNHEPLREQLFYHGLEHVKNYKVESVAKRYTQWYLELYA